jgi:hypothetical protein
VFSGIRKTLPVSYVLHWLLFKVLLYWFISEAVVEELVEELVEVAEVLTKVG